MKLRKNQSFVILPTILVDWWKEQYLTHQEQKLFLTFSWMFWDIEVDLSYKI